MLLLLLLFLLLLFAANVYNVLLCVITTLCNSSTYTKQFSSFYQSARECAISSIIVVGTFGSEAKVDQVQALGMPKLIHASSRGRSWPTPTIFESSP